MHGPYLKWSQMACIICTVCEQPAIDGQSVAVMTNKLPYLPHLKRQPQLQLTTLHSALGYLYQVHEDV